MSIDFADANRKKASLTNKLCSLKGRLVSESVNEEIMECETRLKALIEQDLAGAKVRNRAEWIEKGEKPTSFFFRLERNREQKHFVASILGMDGNEVTDQKDIEKAHVDFYTELYSLSEIDEDAKTSLLEGISRVLPPVDSDCCEGIMQCMKQHER